MENDAEGLMVTEGFSIPAAEEPYDPLVDLNLGIPLPEPPTPRLRTRVNPEGRVPEVGMGFNENLAGQLTSGSVAGQIVESGDTQAVRTSGANMANRGFTDAQMKQLPTRVRERIAAEEASLTPEAKAARASGPEKRTAAQIAYEVSDPVISPSSVSGAVAAGLLSPENYLIGLPAKGAVALGRMVKSALPASTPAIQRAIVAGADAAFGNVVLDPAIQASRLSSGAQGQYSAEQTILAAPIGFVAGAAIRGGLDAATGAGRVAAPDRAGADVEAARPEAAGDAQQAAVSHTDGAANAVPEVAARAEVPNSAQNDVVRAFDKPAKLIGVEPTRMPAHSVATADGGKIDVAPVVVEASTLRTSSDVGYDPAIQPRDRTRAASDVQIRDIVSNLDPDRLGMSAEADRGAPIVGPDAMVESGNGRISAIRAAYAEGGASASKYRAFVESTGADTTGMKEPVLVRQRLTELTPEGRQKFAVSANQSSTLSMSAPERAKADAGSLSPSSLELIRNPDDFGAAANRDFLRAFSQTLPISERATFMSADGSISLEGLSRARNAVLARAYDDANIIARITESTDDDVKSISSALVAAAPEWAKLRADIEAGRVRSDVDQTKPLLEAVSRTADLRANGVSLDIYLRQQDAFDTLLPDVQALMAMFYRADGKRAAGKESISERLRYYAQEARKVSADDGMFADLPMVRAADLQAAAAKKGSNNAGTEIKTGLFDGGKGGARGDAAALRTEGQGPPIVRSGGQADDPAALGLQPRQDGRQGITPSSRGAAAAEALPMARKRVMPGDADTPFTRQILDGETQKPATMPKDATPEEIQAFRVTEAIADLAAQLGRKVEMDKRFTLRGAAGEYKVKDGVIRLRQTGDFEAFAHEAGHAIDYDFDRTTGDKWRALIDAHKDELTKLDANASDPLKKTLREGTAEFLRAYITNPAYARKNMAPVFADAFDKFVDTEAPEMRQWFTDAQRASQIDSAMSPTERMESMIVSAGDQPIRTGSKQSSYPWTLREINAQYRKEGLWPTIQTAFTHFTADYVSNQNVRIEAFRRGLANAAYEYSGQPLPKQFTWKDPKHIAREVQGASQVALDQIQNGVRKYGEIGNGRVSPALTDALRLALGNPARAFDDDDPLGRAFAAYLTARRAAEEYPRYRRGDILNPPIRATEKEVMAAISAYEADHPHWREAGEMINKFGRAMLEKEVDAGILSQEALNQIDATGVKFYVSHRRDMSDIGAGVGGGGSAGGVKPSIRKYNGSSRNIINPLHSLVQKSIALEHNIVQNQLVKSLDMLGDMAGPLKGAFLERIPNTEVKAVSVEIEELVRAMARREGLTTADASNMIREMADFIGEDNTATVYRRGEITPAGERILFYYEGGERVALKLGQNVESRALFDVMSGMSGAERDMMLGGFGRLNAYFSASITSAPSFALSNMIGDGVTRIFGGRNVSVGYRAATALTLGFYPSLHGYYTMLFDKEFAKIYAARGGMRGGVVSQAAREANAEKGFRGVLQEKGALANIRGIPQDLLDELTKKRTVGQAATDLALSPFTLTKEIFKRLIRDVIETTETAGRLGQGKAVYKYLKAQGLSDGEAWIGTMYETQSIMDYSQVGAAMNGFRKVVTFLNPNIQGVAAMNERNIMDPGRAIRQWRARGKDWSRVDPELQQAFKDGLVNWGFTLAGAAMTVGYHAWVSESEAYRRASPYMRDHYLIFPYGPGENDYFTIKKPFDLPGSIFAAIEHTLEGIRHGNPTEYGLAVQSMAQGFVPRQVTGLDELANANPFVKGLYENATGSTVPFSGGDSFKIVPQRLRSLPPRDQYTARTSAVAKYVGEIMDASPMMIDHAMGAIGGTIGRNVNDTLTAIFGENPNMTGTDAAKKIVFGNIYRTINGIGTPANDLMRVMSQDGGKISREANGYKQAKQDGLLADASERFNRADDITKTLMVLRGNTFSPAERALHPLERSVKIFEVVNSLTRDLATGQIQVEDRSLKPGDARSFIDVDDKAAKAISIKLNAMAAEDIISGLAIAKIPGYLNMPIIDTRPRLDMIRGLSPEVADELQARMKKRGILPIWEVERSWPEVKRRLLSDQEAAKFRDLLPPGTKLPRARR